MNPTILRFLAAASVLGMALTGSEGARASVPDMSPGMTPEQVCAGGCALASADCVAQNNSPEYCTGFYAGCYSSCRLF